MRLIRWFTFSPCFCFAALFIGCARSERQSAQDTTATATDTAAAISAQPAAISLAEVAGKWRVRATNEAGDSLVSYELNATADTSGWTIKFPNRPPVPVRVVAVAGDSVVTEAGPYESVLRKGVMVTIRGASRLQGEKLVGSSVARYQTKGPDSVLNVRTEGTRAP